MPRQAPTQVEIDNALMALGAGFKVEHQENDLMCSPAPHFIMRGPGVTAATVEYLQANGLIQPTADDSDTFEPSPDGMRSYLRLLGKGLTEARVVVPDVLHSEAFVAEGHGYYIPPPVKPAIPITPVSEFESQSK